MRTLIIVAGLAAQFGCTLQIESPSNSNQPPTTDAGLGDAGANIEDADGGSPSTDAEVQFIDGGVLRIDGGVDIIDGGIDIIDGGVDVIDGGIAPTCSDGVQNGAEVDVDCGGPCSPCYCSRYAYGRSEYWVCGATVDWNQARAVCTEFGADLASITSLAEQNFVYSALEVSYLLGLVPEPAGWVGGTDSGTEGTWQWSDGSTYAYQDWGSGEPNNGAASGIEEDCMTVCTDLGLASHFCGARGWGDSDCSVAYRQFVCER